MKMQFFLIKTGVQIKYMSEHNFSRDMLFLFASMCIIGSMFPSISYAALSDYVSVSGFEVEDTARGESLFFDIAINNSGTTHVLLNPHIRIFNGAGLQDEVIGETVQVYSYRNKKLKIPYNISNLVVGDYTAHLKLTYAGDESEESITDFVILEPYGSLLITGADAVPSRVGDVVVFSATVENEGSLDLEYSLSFSIVDAFDNRIDTIDVSGHVDRFSADAVQTSWDTGGELPGNYPLSSGEYGLMVEATYWTDADDVSNSPIFLSNVQLLPESDNYFDRLVGAIGSIVFKLFSFLS